MVNDQTLQLLRQLKSSPGPVSGSALARELGISRVALWKRFENLRAAGYPVSAGRTGYRLLPSDKPLPWEFPGEEARTFHFESLASTMDEAQRLGLSGLPSGAVIAERQSQGRGRADRRWVSEGGDLLVTLILRPALPATFSGSLALEALCCLADTLSHLYGLELSLHWPNDLMAGDQKVAGLLVESFGPFDQPKFFTVGLGLNVHGLPHLDRPTTSLDTLGRVPIDRRAILADWRLRLELWVAAPRLDPERWGRRSPLGQVLTFETFDGQKVSGLSSGFDRSGSLLLEWNDTTIPIRFGETRRTQGVSQ